MRKLANKSDQMHIMEIAKMQYANRKIIYKTQ